MAILLGLFAALAYGCSDYLAGIGSRRLAPGPVTVMTQAAAVVVAVLGVLILPGDGPTAAALAWGALGGVGSGVGTLALYRGMAVGAMSPVATCSAVLAAVLPALVGLATGDRLSLLVTVGIVVAIPAIGLVSWEGAAAKPGSTRTGIAYGTAAGFGFGLIFVALDRAGTASGAWPLLPVATTALLLVLPFAAGAGRPTRRWRPALTMAGAAGLLGGTANLLFLGAAGAGQLAVVAVLTALYPAVTVVLARVLLLERWNRVQAAGLMISAGAVVLVSVG